MMTDRAKRTIEGESGVTIDEATERYDVVVLGSGAAGLTAAVTAADAGASVGLFEKADLIGGTAAMSGGIIWMPNNHHQAAAGVEDSRQDALAYLESLSLGQIDSDMAATFVDEGPQMLRWVEENTPCAFHLVDGYPDYHPEHPGGLPVVVVPSTTRCSPSRSWGSGRAASATSAARTPSC